VAKLKRFSGYLLGGADENHEEPMLSRGLGRDSNGEYPIERKALFLSQIAKFLTFDLN
jgi:hypothetical protein